MKILFLSDDFPPQSFGGAGISTYELALGMKKAGHDVFVITTCRKQEEAGESEYNGLKVFKITSDYPGKWRSYLSLYNPPVIRKVENIIASLKPDVVHVNNVHFYLSYHSIKIAKKYAKRVVFTARDAMAFNFGKLATKKYLDTFDARTTWLDHVKQARKRWNPFRNYFIKKYLKIADVRFAVSDALKIALVQNGITDFKAMHTGIDSDIWQIDSSKIIKFKEKYNLKNKKVVLFGGRLSEAKGGGKAFEAFAQAAKSIPDMVFVVVSPLDSYAHAMGKRSETAGISNRLIFTGWIDRDDMKYILALSDIILVPSICFDAFPRTVLEAMVLGKPVIGTCYGGASEAIEDGITGYIVNPFDTEEMARKIIDLLDKPDKAEQFGKSGYERVKKEFNLGNKVKDLIHYCNI